MSAQERSISGHTGLAFLRAVLGRLPEVRPETEGL